MNKQRILDLADHIEKLDHKPIIDFNEGTIAFNMAIYKKYGAPCCIAGWACQLHFGRVPKQTAQNAAEILDIDDIYLIDALFDPQGVYETYRVDIMGDDDADIDINNHNITPKQAAQTLRHLAETGEVVWFNEEGERI